MGLSHPRKSSVLVWTALMCVIVFLHEYRSSLFDLYLYFTSPETYTLPLSLHCNPGRLGNQMCTYATLYGLSKLNGRRFLPLSCNTMHLKDIFVGPSHVKSIYSKTRYFRRNAWEISAHLRPPDAEIPDISKFINGYLYPCSYTFFDHARSDIRREFEFRHHLKQHAMDVLRKANAHHLRNVTYVGLHVRRRDFKKKWLDAFEGVPVNMEYFRRAVKYFRDKYENVLFIGVSDDRLWCIKILSAEFGVHVPEEAPSPAHDLAVLASCNHTIMTYGTFGFWGAYLAGGEVVFFDKFLKPNTTFSLQHFVFDKMYLPEWKGIVTVNASYWLKNAEMTTKIQAKNPMWTRVKPWTSSVPDSPRDEHRGLAPSHEDVTDFTII